MPMRVRGLRMLEHLAIVAGEAAGRAHVEALLQAEAQAQEQAPPTRTHEALARITARLPEWAREAARTPRTSGSQQAQLLDEVKAWMQARREEEDEGEGDPG